MGGCLFDKMQPAQGVILNQRPSQGILV